ncbi:UNVERIFIED_CONTAM: putative pre-splicing factor ATP-dependent RNA helicase DEAH9 [Sesamum calycinum]|uniref:RNA helicase n=1 Tax=Sesamum calycinum TaxID=2727403 RepID=A0AAW2Q6S1_9LAMI
MSRFWKPGTEKPRLVDDEEGGVLFYTASSSSSSGYGHASMEKQRQRLPVFKYRTAILYLVEKHATTIIVGETGSGKTTQIPQELTRIKFLTDGVLLREMMDDPLLSKYSRRSLGRDGEENGPRKNPAILSVEGRGFNVEIFYVEEPVSDYIRAAVSTVNAIHDEEPMGDILVFLTGQDDIDAAIQLLSEDSHNRKQGLIVLPLYSGLPRADQDLVFSPTPRGKRKVVISTNIAETSLTLEGVVYVVDSGFSKQRFYNPITDIENLVVAPISKASARQRAGRAGRVRPGKCYRLYTEEYFINEMSADGIPECRGQTWFLVLFSISSPEALIRALEVLYSLGILDDDAKLTSPAGFQVAEIPLSIWFSVRGAQKELDEAKLRFAAAEGDHITFLNVYKGFIQSGKSSNWCHKNHINYHSMVVRKAVTAGFFANACLEYLFCLSCEKSFSHNGLYKTVNPKWVVFHSIVSTDRQYMRNVISIDPSWLTDTAPQFYQHQQLNPRPH